jgi:hypothetical protein
MGCLTAPTAALVAAQGSAHHHGCLTALHLFLFGVVFRIYIWPLAYHEGCCARRVRWHTASAGTEVDLHNLHMHGNTFLRREKPPGKRQRHLTGRAARTERRSGATKGGVPAQRECPR